VTRRPTLALDRPKEGEVAEVPQVDDKLQHKQPPCESPIQLWEPHGFEAQVPDQANPRENQEERHNEARADAALLLGVMTELQRQLDADLKHNDMLDSPITDAGLPQCQVVVTDGQDPPHRENDPQILQG
jgi:hypothetical protein